MVLTQEEVVDYLSNLSVLDIAKLTKILEEKWGVKAAPIAVAGAAGGAGAASQEAAKVEEKTEFTVILKSGGANKIQVIKAIREITSLGLKEAKDLVEGAPKEIKAGVSKEEAEEMQKKIIAAGGEVQIS